MEKYKKKIDEINFPQRKAQNQTASLENSLKSLKEELTPNFCKLFPKIGEEGTHPSSFYETGIILH